MADVTVIIPTHNRRALLARTLHSVLAQRDVDVEVVVVDDGSSDGTATAVAELRDRRVRLVRHPHPRGVSAARNTGIENASAPWLAFVDDDDLWAPRKLRSQLDAVAASPGSLWSCTGSVNIDGQCRLIWWAEPPGEPDVGDAILAANVIPGGGSGVLASRELTTAVGGFDEAMSNLADWDFYLRLGLRSPLAVVSRPLLGYYVHREGMAHNARRSVLEYRYLEVKYERERAQRRVTFDHELRLSYLASMAFRSGDRMMGLRMEAQRLARYGGYRRTLRSLAVGLAPSDLRAMLRRAAKTEFPSNWREEAEAWLAPYASGWLDSPARHAVLSGAHSSRS
jgi:glycosyltransferase involved in cell wall biosynthesis